MRAGLTAKQRAFVDAYAGNATEAAIAAGYKANSAKQQAYHLMRLPHIIEALRHREAMELHAKVQQATGITKKRAARIADRDEVLRRLTKIARDVSQDTKDRLKALELLGKSYGAFTDKVQHEGDLAINIVDPYAKPTD